MDLDKRMPTNSDTLTAVSKATATSFFANVATVLGGQAASVAIALLIEICYARLAGPGARGQISLCMMTIAFGVLVGGLGADIPIVIWSADRQKKASDWLSAVLLWGAMGTAAAGALWWAVFEKWQLSLLRGVTPSLARVILLSIPFAILFSYLTALLTGRESFRERAGVGLLESAAGLIAFLGLTVLLGRNANAAVWGNLAGLVVGVAVSALLLKNVISGSLVAPSATQDVIRGLGVGLRGQIGNVAAFFNYRLDVFIVNYFLDPTQVGLYAFGVAVSEALWQIPGAVAVALFPRTARTIDEGATNFTCLIMRQVFLVSCISALGVALVSPWAVPILFGGRFSSSVPVIWWLLPGAIAISLAKIAASDLAGRGKTGYSSLFGGIALGVTVILDLLLIPRMGIQGAGLASSAAYVVNAALLVTALKFELQVRWRELFVPSRIEFARYKKAWFSFAVWSGMRSASL
jgi:O-antigen/teichoic acid export membrane protein